jgi:hypothetical protein
MFRSAHHKTIEQEESGHADEPGAHQAAFVDGLFPND